LIAWLQANPDKASAGIISAGSQGHLCALELQNKTGVRFPFAPYRGGAPMLQDLVGGQIDLTCNVASNELPQVRSGNVKAFAVAAKARWFAAPDVPTVDEQGLPGIYASYWYGLWVPKNTPRNIITTLNAAARQAMADPAVRKRLADQGMEIPPMDQQSPEALRALQQAEIDKWWPIIKAAAIKGE
jgi:tripartite-type tricarboxylate transporter receptor subunit TctC